MTTTSRQDRKFAIAQWAETMLKGALILDTETTGLHEGEICEITVINCYGETLLNTHVKPINGIPEGATAIHGITNEMVAAAPRWSEVVPQLMSFINDSDLVVYNALYDRRMFHQSDEAANLPRTEWRSIARWYCAMKKYAEYWGDWNDYHQSYRWQKLTDACWQQRIPDPDAPAHSALGDCLRTLAVLKAMAAYQPK